MNPTDKLSTLVTSIQAGQSPKWLFFWGHTPSKDGSVSKSCFSQWWEGNPFKVGDVTYSTAEHYMMAEKARLFGDMDSLQLILRARTPAEAKKLGKKVAHFDEPTWVAARYNIVFQANLAKFTQHPQLNSFLLETGDRVLVEASPFDRIWGIGMASSDPHSEQPDKWKGLNLLGFALMDVRDHLLSNQTT